RGEAPGLPLQDLEGPDSLNWPKEIDTPELKITVYQPQLENLKGNQLSVRAAVSLQKAGSPNPVFGGVWLDAQLITDRDQRSATPINVRVTEARFPSADPKEVAELRQAVVTEIPKWSLTLSMDHLMAELKLQGERQAAAQGLKNDPPRIVYRSHPAVILAIDGAPSWRALPGTTYQRIANSAFFVLQDPALGSCYLHIPPFWWTAAGPLGPWEATDTVPGAVQDQWNSEPKPDLPAADAAQEAPARPEVIVATEPTELLVTQGPAQYVPLTGTDLLYVKNSENDVFIDTGTQLHYVLLSGRWYRKPAGKGASWAFVPPEELPPDFGRIPPASDRGHVLASVAGTTEARDAVLDAEIPQTVAVTPGPAPDLSVTYDGDPQFTEIPDCSVEYATNTPYSVFHCRERYYCCQDGIWYDSEIARGRWAVCVQVPEDIYLIPPSCPHYYCTYCHVFGSSPDAVYVGYYPGYRGCFVGGRTVVYGTGWHYSSWAGHTWYPRPVTWGCGVRYNTSTGNWGFRLGAGGPCAWMGLSYHSDWKGHAVSVGVGGWWGGVGTRHTEVDVHRNLNFADHVDRRADHNIYAREPQRLAPAVHTRLPQQVRPLPPERRAANNVYVDPKGNAYRKPPEGGWEKHTSEGWKKDLPATSPPPSHSSGVRAETPPERHEIPRGAPSTTREVPRTPAPSPPHEPPRTPPAPVHHDVPPIPAHHVQLEQQNQARTVGNQRAQNFHQNPPPRPAPRAPAPRQKK
ncbi:MAG TPA: hypothetical protein VMU54_14850, partial [Planctomycetota bacterium]|nr:hypothetical protein [Planctomycetota bacterium]